MKDEIIDYIQRNRVSTTEVADCLNKSGAIEGVMPINRGHFRVGTVKWVYAYGESNWDVHEQVIDTQKDDVVFVESFDCKGRAIFGELVSKFLVLYRRAAAIVVRGTLRDAGALIRENYPVWCQGLTPVGCFNKKVSHPFDAAVYREHREMYHGAIAVCDDCGVVIIPPTQHTPEFLKKLEAMEHQEDIWFHRLDHYKENTFDIVCLKKYLTEEPIRKA